MNDKDLLILAAAALAVVWIVRQKPAAATSSSTAARRIATKGRFTVPDVLTPGGGWLDGIYTPNLLEQQYAQGWGFGD